ncbi:unnamed protein product [Schistosoma rodhaini]|uniref:Uncharacterized protein n=1 Tax=Schistosoma rodhaini TaxID=6188 RepID=A0AA85GHI7_9TREM|nr:unnamed protein product [Schistosoma rodhaini]
MKTCFVQALVLTIYILGVQYLVTADNTSLELEDAYFKLNKYTEAIKTVEREKIYIEELVLYATNTTEKQFRDGIIRLENKYAAKWILDLFKNIIPNDRDLLQTYSENYKRVPEISRNLDDYYYGSVEYAIMIKWDARLNFDLATNKYLNMLASTKNSSLTASNGKSLSERKMSLKQLEKEYKLSKSRIRTLYNKVIQTGVTYRIVYESVEKNLWKSNPKLHNVQNEVNEMKAIRKDLIRDLVQTEKEARNTSDSNKRGILEREIEDLINGINALEEKLENSQKNFNEVLDNLRFDDHLEILKNLEIRRIDVLELLSSKERIQMYESILQVELNSI